MGCCLGKIKAKRNSVSPSYIEDEIRKRISGKSVKRDAPGASLLKEMAKQLEDAEIEESKMTKGGVSFTLDFKTEDEKEVHYTASEKELLAELLREDILREKSVKARRDVQLYDAARRRAAYNT
ncbi:uncharacterized protein LOC123523395 isoform X2 [Mercenaria mercenaria]|uniref:uncharacterized protein LOC123523395 isoform X2 n=1 Tax=Mercenaria mercenaria TaxID=6596 RepID=UPI00234F6620|nr:uncharacterized protein LOC123523395 isoform X2 [Mercenaria mercenaria]